MKKKLWILLALALLAAVFAGAAALAETSGTCGENVQWKIYNGDILSIYGTGPMYDYTYVTLKDEDGDTYYEYTNPWRDLSGITRVDIAEGVTRIGNYAFAGDSTQYLKYVGLPVSLTEIGDYAFYEKTFLDTINLSESVVEKIGKFAFYGCTNLPNFSMYTIQSIGHGAFGKCKSLTEVRFFVSELGNAVFEGCEKLKTVYVSSAITSLPMRTFMDCYALENVYLAGSLQEIGYGAFERDLDVKKVYYSGSSAAEWAQIRFANESANPMCIRNTVNDGYGYGIVNSPSAYLYLNGSQGYTLASEIHMKAGDGDISQYAFIRCPNNLKLILDDGYTGSIGANAFKMCTGLSEIEFLGQAPDIEATAFTGVTAGATYCPGDSWTGRLKGYGGILTWNRYGGVCGGDARWELSDVHALTISGTGAMSEDSFDSGLFASMNVAALTVEEGITGISFQAFRKCGSMTSATLPASLTTIDDYAFDKCDALTDVYYGGTAAQRAQLSIGTANAPLANAAWHYTRCADGHAGIVIDPAVEPGCESEGLTEGSHCEVCGEIIAPQEPVAALGHEWGETAYAWSGDHSRVTATRVCARDEEHAETETVEAQVSQQKAATCEEAGFTVWTSADFENEAFAAQTAREDAPVLGHLWGAVEYRWLEDHASLVAKRVCERDESHVESEAQMATAETVKAATCEEEGLRIWTSEDFRNEAFAAQSDEEVTPPLGHDWGVPRYVWSEDFTCVTATRACGRNAEHVETEDAAASGVVTKEPGCEETGVRTWTSGPFDNPAFEAQTTEETMPAAGHDWGAAEYEWSEDLTSVTATHVCSRDSDHMETETAEVTVETIEPTCEEPGLLRRTAAFQIGAFETQIREETIDALEHAWNPTRYVWNDDNTAVTATRVCARDAEHVETETVAAAITESVAPACEENGRVVWESEAFRNPAFEVQRKEDTLPATGHDMAEPVYTWSEDSRAVTAAQRCSHGCGLEIVETARAAGAVTASPTETEPGQAAYSAEFENAAFLPQTKTAEIPALRNLSVLRLPANLHRIEEEAFAGGRFEAVLIPEGCASIGSGAFANCGNLIYVAIPAGVTDIAGDAFAGCPNALFDRAE